MASNGSTGKFPTKYTVIIIASVIIILLCVAFSAFAGVLRSDLSNSNYKTGCTNQDTITNIDTASSRIDWVFGVCLTLGSIALITIIVSIVLGIKARSATVAKNK